MHFDKGIDKIEYKKNNNGNIDTKKWEELSREHWSKEALGYNQENKKQTFKELYPPPLIQKENEKNQKEIKQKKKEYQKRLVKYGVRILNPTLSEKELADKLSNVLNAIKHHKSGEDKGLEDFFKRVDNELNKDESIADKSSGGIIEYNGGKDHRDNGDKDHEVDCIYGYEIKEHVSPYEEEVKFKAAIKDFFNEHSDIEYSSIDTLSEEQIRESLNNMPSGFILELATYVQLHYQKGYFRVIIAGLQKLFGVQEEDAWEPRLSSYDEDHYCRTDILIKDHDDKAIFGLDITINPYPQEGQQNKEAITQDDKDTHFLMAKKIFKSIRTDPHDTSSTKFAQLPAGFTRYGYNADNKQYENAIIPRFVIGINLNSQERKKLIESLSSCLGISSNPSNQLYSIQNMNTQMKEFYTYTLSEIACQAQLFHDLLCQSKEPNEEYENEKNNLQKIAEGCKTLYKKARQYLKLSSSSDIVYQEIQGAIEYTRAMQNENKTAFESFARIKDRSRDDALWDIFPKYDPRKKGFRADPDEKTGNDNKKAFREKLDQLIKRGGISPAKLTEFANQLIINDKGDVGRQAVKDNMDIFIAGGVSRGTLEKLLKKK